MFTGSAIQLEPPTPNFSHHCHSSTQTPWGWEFLPIDKNFTQPTPDLGSPQISQRCLGNWQVPFCVSVYCQIRIGVPVDQCSVHLRPMSHPGYQETCVLGRLVPVAKGGFLLCHLGRDPGPLSLHDLSTFSHCTIYPPKAFLCTSRFNCRAYLCF